MFAENESAMKKNNPVLNDLPGELYTIQTHNKLVNTNVNTHWEQFKLLRMEKTNKQWRLSKVT